MDKPIYIVVTPFFPSPETWRGAYCYDFVKALMRTGKYDVRVFVPGNGLDYDCQGVHVYRFPIRHLPSNIFPFLFKYWNQRSFINKVKSIGIDIKNVAVCHGHTANYAIFPLAIKQQNNNCLILLHHHDPQSYGLNNSWFSHCWFYNLIQFAILRYIHEQIDCHVFISEMVKRSFLSAPNAQWTNYGYYRKQMRALGSYRSTRIKKSIILHNGVDVSLFHSSIVHKKNKTFTIGCIGNFVDWKDQQTLVKSLVILKEKGVKDLSVRFIGTGPYLDVCKKLVIKHNLETWVTFEAEGDHTLLPDFYRSLDLFVLPSYFEGFGCVFTEAYACGVPFITCEGQGMDDLILPEERHLWLCKQQNPQDLTEKILYYYHHRPVQHLSGPIDINVLVGKFVEEIECLTTNCTN